MKKHKLLKDAMKAAKEKGSPQKVQPQDNLDVKVSISIRLDLDVLSWLKDEGKKQGIPYQTLANSILKKASQAVSVEERLSKIEKALEGKVG